MVNQYERWMTRRQQVDAEIARDLKIASRPVKKRKPRAIVRTKSGKIKRRAVKTRLMVLLEEKFGQPIQTLLRMGTQIEVSKMLQVPQSTVCYWRERFNISSEPYTTSRRNGNK